MIVRNIETGWNIVFHEAHGLLASQIAEHLAIEPETDFWFETKQAISIHDDQKVDTERGSRHYVTAAGAPKDFTLLVMDDLTRATEAEACIRHAIMKDRWIGLLVSLHNDVLYRHEKTCKEMKRLLAEQDIWREQTLLEMSASQDQLQIAYDWLHLCDRCSLLLCGDDVPSMQRRIEIITHSNGDTFYLWQDREKYLRVDPWPFRADAVTVQWEQRTLKQLSFVDDYALQKELEKAKVSVCEMIFKK